LNELTRASSRREAPDHVTAAAVDTMPLPVDRMAAEQSVARLRAALNRLPIADRTALALVYVRELPLSEVAALEGTTVGALKVRLHRARLKLREWLENADE
jgi:RNA polymerase sigma-70 factor (ECF subfamily)